MTSTPALSRFEALLSESLGAGQFVKLSLGNYQGQEEALRNIYVKQVLIKRQPMLSFNYRYKTRDIFKNHSLAEGISLIVALIEHDFKIATLFTVQHEYILEHRKNTVDIREKALEVKLETSQAHNKEKKRLINSNGSYLHDLKITDAEGKVYKNAQDKYKQINQYIEILSSLIKELPKGTIKNVVDMGAGKGYLTFALYDYLHTQLQLQANVVGVEYREDLVALSNTIAQQTGFEKLQFVQGTIEDYHADQLNLLIALHACDTATDDAIFKGIKANAELIVVAPCCHKQIRREIERNKVQNNVSFLTQYGIFLERQAEMVTDGIRALILEYFGYKTKVLEFISDAHTPKNVLVVGVKRAESPKTKTENERKAVILQKIKDTKAYFGIGYHHLERLLALN
ncbi:class I SAM-dependent methyltransferase [Pedobacter sp. ASV12]|uniref:class I SAM-dependent methyltransferase n=1 Tax=Pedobacter sp. ASV12 TaxID=2795120 RepID=UPI0018EAE5AF|nr:SAM-dependent methyltransferase [Pedobacter sp. ASV12]